jgi:hypothetical protein
VSRIFSIEINKGRKGKASNELPVFVDRNASNALNFSGQSQLAFLCPVLSMLSAANGIIMTHGVLFKSAQKTSPRLSAFSTN